MEQSSIPKTKGGEVLVKVGPKTTKKSTFYEGLLVEKALIFSLEVICPLKIRDLD